MSNVTPPEFRAWKRTEINAAEADVQEVIDAAEWAIADTLKRTIALAGASATARSFRAPSCSTVLPVPDIATTTGLVIVNGPTTLTAGQYEMEPLNGLNPSGQGVPYNAIRLVNGTVWYEGLYGETMVTVTAKWGCAALPAPYVLAVKVLAADLLESRDLRNGIVGFTDAAAVRVRENGTVVQLLAGLSRGRSTMQPIRSGAWFA